MSGPVDDPNGARAYLDSIGYGDGIPADKVGASFWENSGLGADYGIAQGAVKLAKSAVITAVTANPGIRTLGTLGHPEVGDRMLDAVLPSLDNAVDYWKPDPHSIGRAGQIAHGFASMLAPLVAGGGDPAVLALSEGVNTGTDLVDQGVNADHAVAGGIATALATEVGFKVPFLGKTRIAQMATGAAGMAAINATSTEYQRLNLQAAGRDDLAANYDPLDPTSRTVDILGGLLGGAIHHAIGARAAVQANPDAVDAALTLRNAEHFTDTAHPGTPATPAASVTAQDALSRAIEQAAAGEPVNVADVIQKEMFVERPEPPAGTPPPPTAAGALATIPGTPEHAAMGAYRSFERSLESRGDPNAHNPASTALGIDQFTGSTWNNLVEKHRPSWAEGMTPAEILDARRDPVKSGEMADHLDHENADALRHAGVAVDNFSLYAAHHFGPDRAIAFAKADGATPMAEILTPEQLHANTYLANLTKDEALANWSRRTKTPYTAAAPPRLEGETDKVYAKRGIDTLPAPLPEHLPDDPALYFNMTDATPVVDIKNLRSTKSAEENVKGGGNGLKRMAAAAEGVLGKRDPIDVLRNVDGTYSVADGNGTLTAAQAAGFKTMPVNIIGDQPVREALAQHTKLPADQREGLAQLYDLGVKAKPIFDAQVSAIADELGASFQPMFTSLKGFSRTEEKIAGKYKGDTSRIGDLVRGTLVIDHLDDLPAALEKIQARFPGAVIENSYAPGAKGKSGYRDANINVEVGGIKAELQVNIPEMLEANSTIGHKLYEKARVISERRVAEQRDLTPEENAELDDLEQQIQSLYGAAFAEASRPRNAASSITEARMKSAGLAMREPSPSQASTSQVPGGLDIGMPSSTANRVPSGNLGSLGIGATSFDQSIPPANPTSKLPPIEATGKTAEVVTERGAVVPVRWAVVEAADLVASHDNALRPNPDFPAELQPRDRTRAASEAQITKIANNIDPELLGESRKASDGAPIVGADRVVESGNARTIALRRAYAGGKAEGYRAWLAENAAKFGIDPAKLAPAGTDAATGLALNADGTVTVYHHTSAENAAKIRKTGKLTSAGEPQVYFTSTPDASTGYGDTAVPVRVKPETLTLDDEFSDGRRDYSIPAKKAGLKVTIGEAGVGAMREPVLVRVITAADHNRAEFARQANESSVATMSATEQAASDAARLPDLARLVANEDGTINGKASSGFVGAFMQALPPTEHGAMMSADGTLSQAGQNRIRNAVFSKAYGDSDLVAMLTESTDANVKTILAGMMKAAVRIAKLREDIAAGARHDLDFAPDMVAAVREFSALRSKGRTVRDHLAQSDLYNGNGDPAVNAWLIALDENSNAPKRIADLIGRQVDAVEAMGHPGQPDLLRGGSTGPSGTKADVLQAAVDGIRRDYRVKPSGSLFGANGKPTAEAKAAGAPKPPEPLPEAAPLQQAAAEDPAGVVLDGFDPDGNPRYRAAAEILAEVETDRIKAAKDAEAYEAAVNCHIQRGLAT